MSWVEPLGSGRYRAVYRDDDDRRHSKTFDRKAEAKSWLAAAKADQDRGQWVDPRGGAMLFGEWADQWLAARLVRPTTLACDRGRLRNHLKPAFGDVPLKDLTPLRVRAYVAELTGSRSPATVRHIHALLSAILGEVVQEGLLLSNPCRRTKLPPPPRYDGVFLSSEQLDRLVEAVDPAVNCTSRREVWSTGRSLAIWRRKTFRGVASLNMPTLVLRSGSSLVDH